MRLKCLIGLLCILISAAANSAEPFLDQTKKIPDTAEWSREITTKKGGKVGLTIEGPLPVHVFVITSEFKDKIAKNEKVENPKEHVFANKKFEKGPIDLEVNLKPNSYQVMIQNLSGKEAEYRLKATEVVEAEKKKAGE